MTTPLIEQFSGTAAALAGVWTQQEPAVGTLNKDGSNHGASSSTVDDTFAYRNDRTFTPNQYSQTRIFSGLSSGLRYTTVLVRCSGVNGTAQDYEFYTDGVTGAGHTEIAKRVGNVATVILVLAATFASLDVMILSALDTGTGKVLLTAYKNGVSIGSVTDSASIILSGAPGVGALGTTMLITDWEGGDLPTRSTGVPYKNDSDVGFLLEDNSGLILTE